MSLPFVTQQIRARSAAAIPLDQPCEVGELPTPALVLDRAALSRNIQRMADYLGARGKGFRPHAKTHKCPLIAQLQIQAGAVGVCVAKVGEAVAMQAGGIEDLLITSPVATRVKAEVVAELARENARLCLVVDSQQGLDVLCTALSDDAHLGVVIDLDAAMGRTGTRDDELVLRLHEQIDADPRLRFVGFQHYAGHVMHVEDFAQRRAQSLALWSQIEARLARFADRGIVPDVVTGAGTGTYNIDVEVAALTDLQVGSYIVMDEEYRAIGGQQSERFEDFEVALSVACTAISEPTSRAVTLDGGYKAFASDSVAPVCDDIAGAKFRFAGDEHGVLIKPEGEQSLRLGDVIRFVTPHCDPTVNLHDYYWVLEEDGRVHSCWPITARGCVW